MKLLLDTNILTRLCHPHKDVNLHVNEWLEKLLGLSSFTVIVPEIADYEVLLAAQALEVSGVVVTENVRHLSRFVESRRWQDVEADAP